MRPNLHLFILIVLFFLPACTLQKRLYCSGWHVEWHRSIKPVQGKKTDSILRFEPTLRQKNELISSIQEVSSRLHPTDSSNAFTVPAIEIPHPNPKEISVKSVIVKSCMNSPRNEASVQKKNTNREGHNGTKKWVILFVLVVIVLLIIALISISYTATLVDTIGILLFLLLLLVLLTCVVLLLGTQEKRQRKNANRKREKKERREREIQMSNEEWQLQQAVIFRKVMLATILMIAFFILIALLLISSGIEPVFLGGLGVVFLLFILIIWIRYWRQKPLSKSANVTTDAKKWEKDL